MKKCVFFHATTQKSLWNEAYDRVKAALLSLWKKLYEWPDDRGGAWIKLYSHSTLTHYKKSLDLSRCWLKNFSNNCALYLSHSLSIFIATFERVGWYLSGSQPKIRPLRASDSNNRSEWCERDSNAQSVRILYNIHRTFRGGPRREDPNWQQMIKEHRIVWKSPVFANGDFQEYFF